jgi:hypothetical protein
VRTAFEAARSLWGGVDILFFLARDIREFDPRGDWDAIVFSEVLSYLAMHEAIAEVPRYAKALSVAISMMNDGKSRAIWRALRQEFRWIDGILRQQKGPWPSYLISVSRGHPGYLVGVLGLPVLSPKAAALIRNSRSNAAASKSRRVGAECLFDTFEMRVCRTTP